MYYPIFRGKQYEFLTLRESISKLKDSGKIIPVIEPVKSGKSSINSLYRCLNDLNEAALKAIFIVNPRCRKGDFHKNIKALQSIVEKIRTENSNVSFGYWVGAETSILELEDFIRCIDAKFYLLHYSEYSNLEYLLPLLSQNADFLGHFLDVDALSDIYLTSIDSNRILLRDNFIRFDANEEYRFENDDLFSTDYLSFHERKYEGFSDYLTIGSKYSDDGGTPETVAIHITYETYGKDSIRVRHCLSNHYAVNQDRGKMIREALTELKEFLSEKPEILNYSSACAELMLHLDNEEKNTSLANIKKLAMRHHLELIINVLDDYEDDTEFSEAS
ncbi:MAG: sce7725 family protein [Bacilli bacterium]